MRDLFQTQGAMRRMYFNSVACWIMCDFLLFFTYSPIIKIKINVLLIDYYDLIEYKKIVIMLVWKLIYCYYLPREIKFVVLQQIFVN